MKPMRVERLGKLFRAAANPKRIRIIKAVMAGSSSINGNRKGDRLVYIQPPRKTTPLHYYTYSL